MYWPLKKFFFFQLCEVLKKGSCSFSAESLWQICSAYGSYSVCCIFSQLWWAGVLPLAFPRSEGPFTHVGIGVGCCTLSGAQAPAARQGGKGHSSSGGLYLNAFIFNISRLLPWGAVRCFIFWMLGNSPAPEVLTNGKDKEMAPRAALSSTTEANRVVPKENNTECSQPAAAWSTAAVLGWSEGWSLGLGSERKRERSFISFLLPTVPPRSKCNGAERV